MDDLCGQRYENSRTKALEPKSQDLLALYGDSSEPILLRDTFVLFPQLPFELRHRIWVFAIWTPRNIYIKTRAVDSPVSVLPHRIYYPILNYLEAYAPQPAVLQINRECRTEALKHMSSLPLMNEYEGRLLQETKLADKIYLNTTTDTVYLLADGFSNELRQKTLKEIRRLSICQPEGEVRSLKNKQGKNMVGVQGSKKGICPHDSGIEGKNVVGLKRRWRVNNGRLDIVAKLCCLDEIFWRRIVIGFMDQVRMYYFLRKKQS